MNITLYEEASGGLDVVLREVRILHVLEWTWSDILNVVLK